MPYTELIKIISRSTGASPSVVRNVLEAFPEALMQDTVGNKTKTPLGIFVMKHRNRRKITMPDNKTISEVPAAVYTRLKEDASLTIKEGNPKWRFFFEKPSRGK